MIVLFVQVPCVFATGDDLGRTVAGLRAAPEADALRLEVVVVHMVVDGYFAGAHQCGPILERHRRLVVDDGICVGANGLCGLFRAILLGRLAGTRNWRTEVVDEKKLLAD